MAGCFDKSIFHPGKVLLYLFFIIIPFAGNTQNNQTDSLVKLVVKGDDDTIKVNALLNLAKEFCNSEPDKTISYANSAITISSKLHFQEGEGFGYKWLGLAYKNKGKYFEALMNTTRSLNIFEALNDTVVTSNILNNLGAFFSNNGEDSKAVEYILKSLSLAEALGDKHRIENALINIGVLYSKNPATHNKALEYYYKALPFALEIKDEDGTGTIYSNLGEIYIDKSQFDSAYYFLKKSLEIYDNSPGAAYSYWDLGKLYIKKKNYDSALINFKKAYNLATKFPSPIDLAQACNGQASVYLAQGNLPEAINYYKKSSEITRELAAYTELKEAYKGLAASYFKMGDNKNAFTYQDLLNDLYEEETNEKLTFNTATLEYTIELQKQSGQVAQLMKKNELQQLNLDKEKMAKNASITGLAALLIIAFILLRNIRHRKKLNKILLRQKEEIQVQKSSVEQALTELKSTQSQLIQSEKMASLGELTAGIAHEIQNPLNFVNNFSEVSNELLEEMKVELEQGNSEEVLAIAADVQRNLTKILHHGKRADGIVKGMLQHSRSSTGQKEPTDINALLDEFLRLTYHGLKAKDRTFNPSLKTEYDKEIGKVDVIPQDLGRVILNLITNALYAVNDKYKTNPAGYQPTVTVISRKEDTKVILIIKDNGNGIPEKVMDKIFQPFFTTKPSGEGTGLGLSLSYDIVKAHGGELKVETKEGEGSSFIIELPVS